MEKANCSGLDLIKKYSQLLEYANDIILYLNEDGQIIEANLAACEAYGYNKEEFVTKNFAGFEKDSSFDSDFRTSHNLIYETWHVKKDGTVFPVEVSTTRVIIDNMKIFLSVIRDITERKKSEAIIIESELKYRSLFQNMQEGVVVYEIVFDNNKKPMDFIICDVNQAFMQLAGLEYKDLINKSIWNILPNMEITNQNLLNMYYECIAYKMPIEKEIEMANGSVWYEVSCFTFNSDYLYVSFSDITEWKKTDIEIRKLYYAIEQSKSVIVISDYEGFIEYVNPMFQMVTGYSLEEVKGKNPDMLISDISPLNYVELQKQFSSKHGWKGELLTRKKNGEYYWAWTSISPIKNENGEIINFISIQEDISELKALHHDLEEKNVQLAEALNDLQKTHSQLIQNEKLAGIGQLAAGVAHEINNPLAFVISNVEVLKKYISRYEHILMTYRKCMTHLEDNKNMHINTILQEIQSLECDYKLQRIMDDMPDLLKDTKEGLERITKIVQGLRTFSRVDYLDSYEDYDINLGIDTALLVATNEIKYYATVERNFDNVPLIYANGGQINQVILNIIINAVHAIKSKNSDQGIIKIRTRYDENFIYCEIEDNGIGIKKENLKHIFEPFFTTKDVGEGTGLGLSISHDIIVNKHKGDISVTSKVNQGTIFIIKLPRINGTVK